MKKLTFLCLFASVLMFLSCAKDENQDLTMNDKLESDDLLRKAAPPCITEFFVQGLPPGGSVTVTRVPGNFVVGTFGNGTHYGNQLNKNTTYIISVNGCYEATVTWCSCGNNLGSESLSPASPWFALTTSSNTAHYTICSF